MTDIEDKIRALGRLAVGQLAHLERLDPLDPLQMQEFEQNAALSTALIDDIAVSIKLQGQDSYDIFCGIIEYCSQNNSDAADILKTCMKQIRSLRGRS